MPLSSVDLIFYYTDDADQATNTLSLGGTISPNTITDAVSNNVYDDVTGDESASGDTEYRAIAMKDTHATHDFINAKCWIDGYQRAASDADTISFALENPGGSPASLQLVADESTAPDTTGFTVKTGSTTSWTEEGEPSATLEFGTLDAGEWAGIWFRRAVPANAAAYTDRSCTLKWQGETTASPFAAIIERTFLINWNKEGFTIFELTPEIKAKTI